MPDTGKHTVHEVESVIPNSHFMTRKLEAQLVLGHQAAFKFNCSLGLSSVLRYPSRKRKEKHRSRRHKKGKRKKVGLMSPILVSLTVFKEKDCYK